MKKRVLSIILLVCMIAVFCPIQAQADTPVDSFKIYIAEPVEGEYLFDQFGFTIFEEGIKTDYAYNAFDEIWYDESGEEVTYGTAQPGQLYTVKMDVYTDSGYYFPPTVSVTVNGKQANIEKYDATYLCVTYTFPRLPYHPITSVAVTIIPPSVTAKPSYDVIMPAGANYYSRAYNSDVFQNDVAWVDNTTGDDVLVNSTVFKAGHEYTANIYLTPKEGYYFSSDVTATFNGRAVSPFLYSRTGQLKVSYTFPALPHTAGWVTSGDKIFYDEDGYFVTGFKQIDGKWYFFSTSNGALQTGWVQYIGKYYYLSPSDGTLQTGVVQIGSNYYYFSPSTGALQTGIVKIGSNYYYFSPSTGALQTGIVKIGSNYYYFSPSTGALQAGWVNANGKYYYFDPSTGAMWFKWLNYNGSWYYLSPSTGNPVTGTQVIDGKTYKFNSYGVCIG